MATVARREMMVVSSKRSGGRSDIVAGGRGGLRR